MTSRWQRSDDWEQVPPLDMDAAFKSMQLEADNFVAWLDRDRASSAKDVIAFATQDPRFPSQAVGLITQDPRPAQLMADVLKYTSALARQLADERGVTVPELLLTLADEPEFLQDEQ